MNKYGLLLLVTAGLMTGCANTSKKAATAPVAETKAATTAESKTEATQAKAAAAPTKPTSIDTFVCSRDSDIREIYIEPLEPSGCKLWYSNHKPDPVASSSKGLLHCETVNQNIRKNLETAGYKCGAVSKTAAK